MDFIKNILYFIKKIFNKEEIKMLEAPTEPIISKEKKNIFFNTIKINVTKNKKVETLVCYGDGLGIQTKISY